MSVIAEIVVVVAFLLYVLFAAVSINEGLTWHCSMLERLRFKMRKTLTRPSKCDVQKPNELFCIEKDFDSEDMKKTLDLLFDLLPVVKNRYNDKREFWEGNGIQT